MELRKAFYPTRVLIADGQKSKEWYDNATPEEYAQNGNSELQRVPVGGDVDFYTLQDKLSGILVSKENGVFVIESHDGSDRWEVQLPEPGVAEKTS